jgi:tryptophan synthase alpha chain
LSAGFVYVVSSVGVTGERVELPSELAEFVERVKAARVAGAPPVAVGFGISTSGQAAQVARMADGVIVGSAIVRRQRDPRALGAFVADLAVAVHGA